MDCLCCFQLLELYAHFEFAYFALLYVIHVCCWGTVQKSFSKTNKIILCKSYDARSGICLVEKSGKMLENASQSFQDRKKVGWLNKVFTPFQPNVLIILSNYIGKVSLQIHSHSSVSFNLFELFALRTFFWSCFDFFRNQQANSMLSWKIINIFDSINTEDIFVENVRMDSGMCVLLYLFCFLF